MEMNELTRQAELDRLVTEWNSVAPEYDAFPRTLQPVKAQRIHDPIEALQLGRYIGFCSITRQIKVGNVDLKAPGLDEIFDGPPERRVTVYITRPLPIGTGEIGKPNPNFVIVGRVYNSDVHAFEIGCFHSMEQGKTSQCYREFTCTKCGWGYAVDSSD